MIEKLGPHKWVLFSHKGEILGTHPTKEAAVAQEHAVNISKARAHGYRIPYPRKRR